MNSTADFVKRLRSLSAVVLNDLVLRRFSSFFFFSLTGAVEVTVSRFLHMQPINHRPGNSHSDFE